jgi:hypothetical protein
MATVFISYSHDSAEHADRVLALAERLRCDGIDTTIDQYETSPPEGWHRWTDRHIRDATFVLMVCSDTYCRRVMGEERTGTGLGVRWEGNLIYQHFYDAGAVNTKFIPVLLAGGQPSHISGAGERSDFLSPGQRVRIRGSVSSPHRSAACAQACSRQTQAVAFAESSME